MIKEALTRVLNGQFTQYSEIDISKPKKMIVFSDHHRGAGDGADEFRKCEKAYTAALNHYLSEGWTLILLGDVEELWENSFKEVKEEYWDVLELEAEFPVRNYYRIWGNHDDIWMDEKKVNKYLGPYRKNGRVREAINYLVTDNGEEIGTILLTHGHQGTLDSDKLRKYSRFFVRIYRHLQNWFGIGKTSPAQDACLRGTHDTEMYNWASEQDDLLLIVGHTHRPVWSSQTHLQKLEKELEHNEHIVKLQTEIANKRMKYPDCNDSIKTIPCYFNTGCCRFDDGDITGIEIEDGAISLIKWSSTPTQERTILETEKLSTIFKELKEAKG